MKRFILCLVAMVAFPGVCLAGSVTLKNKDKKEVTILVKRSGSTTETGIPAGVSMELVGAPLKVTIKKTGEGVEALDGETVVIEKGKITKIAAEPESEGGGTEGFQDGGATKDEGSATPKPGAESGGKKE